MPTNTRVIVNPESAHGVTAKRWGEIEPRLATVLGEFDVAHTQGPRDAERLAIEAVQAGAQRIVVAGGDGTASEVVSGLLGAGFAEKVQVGLLPLGTGRDLARTLGIPRDLSHAIRALSGAETRQIDAMRVVYCDSAGNERSTFSINVTSLGLTGLTVDLVSKAPRLLPGTAIGGSLAFLGGAIESIMKHRCAGVCIRADGAVVCDEPIVLAAVANGGFFGGGMHIAPDARPDDGLLDLVIVREMSKPQLISSLPSLYRGTHIEKSSVSVHRATRVEAAPSSSSHDPVRIELDGEGLGTLPILVEVLPRAVTIFGAGS